MGLAFEAGVVLGAIASLVFAPYQRVVGFSAGVYCVLGVHFGHLLLHWADMRRGALNRWARLLIFAASSASTSSTRTRAGVGDDPPGGVCGRRRFERGRVERFGREAAINIAGRGPRAPGRAPRAVVLRYAFYVVRADPPEPLTWLSGGDVTDCCYVLRKCGVADELYARFSCRDRDRKRLFRGSATALYGAARRSRSARRWTAAVITRRRTKRHRTCRRRRSTRCIRCTTRSRVSSRATVSTTQVAN